MNTGDAGILIVLFLLGALFLVAAGGRRRPQTHVDDLELELAVLRELVAQTRRQPEPTGCAFVIVGLSASLLFLFGMLFTMI